MTVTLIENFRALFYAPFYAMFALRAFEKEGIDVAMKSPEEFGNSLKALAAGGAEVSWGGPMRLMVARDKDPRASGIAFCEVVGRDPFCLVGRTENPGFRFQDLLQNRLGTVSEVPTPWICLQQDLRLAGIDPSTIKRSPERSMIDNVAALRSGDVDVIQVFQPFAKDLVDEGVGHLWYAAANRGPACYTTLNTTREFIESHPDTVLRITRAVYRVQKWIAAHSADELAATVRAYLPDVMPSTLAACCAEYKRNLVWSQSPIVQAQGIEWKRDAMLASGAILGRLDYQTYIDMRFAEAVVREDPPSI